LVGKPAVNSVVGSSVDLISSFQEFEFISYISGMSKNYWLVKSEPESYSWTTFVNDGNTAWTGVRNFAARLNLRAMKKGDFVFYYHSVTDKQVVGFARVEREAYPDPTAPEGDWSCVDLVPVKPLKKPVSLDAIKADKLLKDIPLVKQSRLSVAPLTDKQFNRVLELAGER
jgi:predicted RNA-binding protein with PUA-like domain